MRSRPALVALVLAGAMGPGLARAQASKFNLKPGATGQACLECHQDFADVLKRPSLHTPVRSRQCIGCHNPHASDHGKLLSAEPDKTCAACHGDVAPKAAKSAHRPVAEGKCTACHDPHGSATKGNLVKAGKVSEQEALSKASNPQALEMNFKGIFLDEGRRILQ